MNCGPDLNNRRPQILAAERLILHFHGVGPVPDGIGSEERNYWCEEDRFKSILDSVCTLSTEIPIEITFDNGNISDAVVALPALVDRGLTASFFVCAGRIGLSGYLDKSAMIDIISSNMDIGSHGWGHADWRRVDDKMLDVEIDEAPKRSQTPLVAQSPRYQSHSGAMIVESCVDCDAARQRRSSRAMGATLR